jgi:putative ABC transport system substrate-binding protein
MFRRTLIGGLAFTAAFPLAAHTQAPNRVYRLGHLANSRDSETFTREITLPELAKLGFVEGRNLIFDGRVGEADALPILMRELLAARPDAVVAVGPALAPAGASTRTVPVVAFGSDPIGLGLAASYAHPGGNVTGVVILSSDLDAKRLGLLREAVPERRRIAMLVPRQGIGTRNDNAVKSLAARLGIELLIFEVGSPKDYQAAFAQMRAEGAQALVIGANPQLQRDSKQLAGLALDAKLPTICEWAEMARDGCMLGYGPSRLELRRRMADQIAKIFQGSMPGDIPIEQPTAFEFTLNLKIARSLDLTVPTSVLTRADEVIE